ncbi:MAG: tetratricopeptide repeat protein, partial [Bacteroidetes bacterium]|nr:tetratricopeptide repeat protein [Bacteroidota bacterium]
MQDTAQVKEWLNQVELLQNKNPDEAVLVAKKALVVSEKLQYLPGMAGSHTKLGNIYLSKKEHLTALSYYENAKSLLLRLNDDYQLARVYNNIGDIYSYRINLRQATDNYREASALFRKTGQIRLLNDCQEKIGSITILAGRTAGAIAIYRRLLALKISLNDEKGVIQTNLILSNLHLSQKNYDSAWYYNKEMVRYAGNDHEILTEAAIQDFIILTFQGKMKEAAEAMAFAEKRVNELNAPKLRVKLLAAITSYYISQKDMVMMEKYFDSTATLINESRSVEMAASGLQLLADMSSQSGDYKLAYRMMRSMNTYKDIFRTEHMDRIGAEIRNTAEAELREKQIEYLNLLNKLKEEKLSKEELQRMALLRENILKDSSLANQQLLMSAMKTESVLRNQQLEKEKELRLALSRENELKQQMLIGERKSKKLLWAGLGAMTLLGAIIFWQNRRQQKKNQIIRKQSTELEVLNKEIHHRVKNNLQVISSMLDLQSQSLQDEKAAAIIREGIQRVQSMAFIHQNLYQGNAVNSVNMQEYIRMLTTHLFQTYNIRTEKIQLHTQIEDPGLHTDTAIPLGMILNELISNALKYAF